MKPHKHSALIKQWADGHKVEILSRVDGGWHDEEYPDWDEDYEYRIKPIEKVVRWLWAFKYSGIWYTHNQYLTDDESEEWFKEHEATFSKKLEWSREEFDE